MLRMIYAQINAWTPDDLEYLRLCSTGHIFAN